MSRPQAATTSRMPAHAIVAQPATLTGSIGVVMVKFVIDGTLKKMGLSMEAVTQGRYAGLYSPIRPFSPEERARVQEQMQATYDSFVEKAAAGRNTTPERIDADRPGPGLDGETSEADWSGRRAGRAAARAGHRQAARKARAERGSGADALSAEEVVLRGAGRPVRPDGPQRRHARQPCSVSAIRGRCRRFQRPCASSAAASRSRLCRTCSCTNVGRAMWTRNCSSAIRSLERHRRSANAAATDAYVNNLRQRLAD